VSLLVFRLLVFLGGLGGVLAFLTISVPNKPKKNKKQGVKRAHHTPPNTFLNPPHPLNGRQCSVGRRKEEKNKK